jgi:hypothetical protein
VLAGGGGGDNLYMKVTFIIFEFYVLAQANLSRKVAQFGIGRGSLFVSDV